MKRYIAKSGDISALGRTAEEAEENLRNYKTICGYGHDHSLAFSLPFNNNMADLLQRGAESRKFADRFTINWLTRTKQLGRRSSV